MQHVGRFAKCARCGIRFRIELTLPRPTPETNPPIALQELRDAKKPAVSDAPFFDELVDVEVVENDLVSVCTETISRLLSK